MVAGFSTTSKTRPLIISKLEEFFREKSVVVRSNRLIDELQTFVYINNRAEAMRGYNDDLVMSFAIGLWVRDTALRLRTQGVELTKKTLSKMMDNEGLYTNEDVNNWRIRSARLNLLRISTKLATFSMTMTKGRMAIAQWIIRSPVSKRLSAEVRL